MSYVLGGTFMRLVQLHARHGATDVGSPRVLFFPLSPPLSHSLGPSIYAYEKPSDSRDIKPTSMAILWRFLRCQVPPSGARIVRKVLQRVLGRYLRHGAFAGRERYGRISPRNVHVKSM